MPIILLNLLALRGGESQELAAHSTRPLYNLICESIQLLAEISNLELLVLGKAESATVIKSLHSKLNLFLKSIKATAKDVDAQVMDDLQEKICDVVEKFIANAPTAEEKDAGTQMKEQIKTVCSKLILCGTLTCLRAALNGFCLAHVLFTSSIRNKDYFLAHLADLRLALEVKMTELGRSFKVFLHFSGSDTPYIYLFVYY